MSRITAKRHLRAATFLIGTIVVLVLLWANKASLMRGVIILLNTLAKTFDGLLG